MTEIDDITLWLIAFLDRVSVASARRSMLSERCAQLRAEEPWINETIDSILAYRRRQSNVRYLKAAKTR